MAFDRGNSTTRQNSFGFGAADRPTGQSGPTPGSWSEAELIAMIPALFASSGDYDPYAGIGSRETPSDTCEEMRSDEHTSELQSLMRISYAVFCLKKKRTRKTEHY